MGSAALPSGDVTFVMTDIEGSTRLLRRIGDRFDLVLDRHVELLRESWDEHDGTHISFRGDSCLAAFHDPDAAVGACAAAQRRLGAESWPADAPLRVRIGVHAGLASPRGTDYVALAVHQTARVMAAAHGGQVLVSDTAAADCTASAGVGLRPMGRYRLRDFEAPVQLSCVIGPGLESDFPAVRAMPVDGHNLAVPTTSFIGRDAEVGTVLSLLGPGRLLTLAGPGGVGKSRLAVAVGLRVAPDWRDGVWLVDLAPVQEARLIGTAVGTAVGAATNVGVDRWEDTVEFLRERRTLLVLDNCEHLAAEIAGHIAALLTTCPDVSVLATGREPLGIDREVVWRVDPLVLPGLDATVDGALEAPAVRLFVERVLSIRRDFAVDSSNVQAVVALTRRLDGLPLALELAAAHMSVLTVDDLVEGVGDRLRTLRSRQRNVPDRQRTMDAVIGWSYRLLSTDEQAVLRRLSVFRSGFSLHAATTAGSDVEGCDVPEVVWALVDKSLVVVDLTANETRYRLLETVRAYARSLLDDEQETVATAVRLTRWWLERVGPWYRMDRIRSGEIENELDNLRALVPMVATVAEENAQELVCSIGHHYYAVHAPSDGISELARYASDLTAPTRARVSLLATLALLHVHAGDVDAARAIVQEAAEVRQVAGGAPPWDAVAVERASGEVALRSGDHTTAAELARETLARDLPARARARMFNLLAIASYFAGDIDRAATAFAEELEVARRLRDEHLLVVAEGNVAELAMRRGDVTAAARHQAACLELALTLGRPVSVALSLIVAARLTADADPAHAVQLHAKAEDVLTENGYQLYDDDLRASEQMLDRARQQLGDTEFSVASDRGRAQSLPEAVWLGQDALARVLDID